MIADPVKTPVITVTVGNNQSNVSANDSISNISNALNDGDVTISGSVNPGLYGDTDPLNIPVGKTLTIDGDFTANGPISNRGTLKVTGTLTLADVTSDLITGTVEAGTLVLADNTTVNGTLTVTGEIDGAFDLTVSSTGSVDAKNATPNGDVTINGGTVNLGTTSGSDITMTDGSLELFGLGKTMSGGIINITGGKVVTGDINSSNNNVTITGVEAGSTVGNIATGGSDASHGVITLGGSLTTGTVNSGSASVNITGGNVTTGAITGNLVLSNDAAATVASVSGTITDAAGTTLTVTGAQTLAAATTVNGTMTFEGALTTTASNTITVAAGGALTLNGAVTDADHVLSTSSDNTGTVTFGAEPAAATTLANWQIDGSNATSAADLNGKTFTADGSGAWTYTSV